MKNKEIINQYKQALKNQLHVLVNKYEGRKDENNNSYKHHNVSLEKIMSTIGMSTVTGASIGTMIAPGVGTAGGAVTGAGVGFFGSVYKSLKVHRHNRKIDNAKTILTLSQDKLLLNDLIEKVCDRVINERAVAILNLYNPNDTMDNITKYLARHLVAAIKHEARLLSVLINDTKIDRMSAVERISIKLKERYSGHTNRKNKLKKAMKTKNEDIQYTLKGITKNEKAKYQNEIDSNLSRITLS